MVSAVSGSISLLNGTNRFILVKGGLLGHSGVLFLFCFCLCFVVVAFYVHFSWPVCYYCLVMVAAVMSLMFKAVLDF